MKKHFCQRIGFLAVIIFCATNFQVHAQTNFSADFTPKAILDVMQRVADWQLTNPAAKIAPTDWIQGAGYAGFMALAGISGDVKYRDAMLAMSEKNQWKPGPRKYHADDQCVGQTYAELYFLYRDPKMLAPLRERFDDILAHPSDAPDLNFKQPHGKALELWSWCDSLFMAPPTWVCLYRATGDEKYLNFALTNFWRTTDYLYDTNEHLYFRDSTYFDKREANGQKVFWSRGNGWVFAGIVRILQYLPANHPDRARFEKLFKDMADKILACQQSDGLWRASLLDPESYPAQETSGSGFFTYALAWGVNQGLLDRAKFEPAVRKAWTALTGCVEPDGKLIHVQPIGADPKHFDPDSTEPYGVGAFLLAGSEVYRMAVLEEPRIFPQTFSVPNMQLPSGRVLVKVTNPSSFHRDCETVELLSQVNLVPALGDNSSTGKHAEKLAVMDGVSSRILDSQIYIADTNNPIYTEKLLFQVDLAPHETRTFYILDASALTAIPPPIVKTFAYYAPERHDDFAWESDRIAHRAFGKALETWKAEPLTSSGYDVWIKRTRDLKVAELYRHQNLLFNPTNEAQDDFKVGKTRGDGGLGIWRDGKLYVSKNWRSYKIITTGPIRSEFELTYDAWDANGRKISETKRISIDAGSNMSRVESTFTSDDKSPVQIGVGLAERPGENVILQEYAMMTRNVVPGQIASWQTSTDKGLVVQNPDEGWQTYWQPQDFNKGTTATAFILPKDSIELFTNDVPDLPDEKFAAPTKTVTEGQPALRNLLAVTKPLPIDQPFVYYIGAGWDMSGDFPDAKSWNDYIRQFASRRDEPLRVTIGN
ncbi:MAG TPA: glycoside hydrolase family 88 protein [Verrucomicrobiae bacterium]|nr:glycoside hydrolase family 88 protein [Verrucomicrobiae bacterium]